MAKKEQSLWKGYFDVVVFLGKASLLLNILYISQYLYPEKLVGNWLWAVGMPCSAVWMYKSLWGDCN